MKGKLSVKRKKSSADWMTEALTTQRGLETQQANKSEDVSSVGDEVENSERERDKRESQRK
jgi:hypothetical protein